MEFPNRKCAFHLLVVTSSRPFGLDCLQSYLPRKSLGNGTDEFIPVEISKQDSTRPHLLQLHLHFFTLFFYFFLVLYIERACPQLAKANLGGPCLNNQITIIYSQKEEIQY